MKLCYEESSFLTPKSLIQLAFIDEMAQKELNWLHFSSCSLCKHASVPNILCQLT